MQRNQFSIGNASGFIHPVSNDITPQAVYQQRRDLLKRIAAGVAGTSMAAWASREALAQAKKPSLLTGQSSKVSGASTMECIHGSSLETSARMPASNYRKSHT